MKTNTINSILRDSTFRFLKSYRYRALDPRAVGKSYFGNENTADLCARLEELLQKKTKRDFVRVTGSGNHAFELVMQNLIYQKKKTIGLPVYTCDNLVRIIQESGGKVDLADIGSSSLNVEDPRVYSKSIDAVVGIHTHGKWLNCKKYEEFERETGKIFIEDGAHALGGGTSAQPIGSSGWASILSFRKNTYAGSGGAVGTNDAKFAAHLSHELEKTPFADEGRDAWGKLALIAQSFFPGNAVGYPLYSRYEYSAMRLKKTRPSRMDLCVALSHVERVCDFVTESRDNARALHHILMRGGFIEKKENFDEKHGYCRYLIRFPTSVHAKSFIDKAQITGFELGMNYSSDFEENISLAGQNVSRFPQSARIAALGVPIGLHNITRETIELAARFILEGVRA